MYSFISKIFIEPLLYIRPIRNAENTTVNKTQLILPHETYRLLRKTLSNYANANVSGDKNTLSRLLILNRIRVQFDFLPIFHTKLLPHLEFWKHILNRKLIKHLELKRDLFLFYHKENINIRLTKPCSCLLPDPSSAPTCSVILAFCNHFLGLPSSL